MRQKPRSVGNNNLYYVLDFIIHRASCLCKLVIFPFSQVKRTTSQYVFGFHMAIQVQQRAQDQWSLSILSPIWSLPMWATLTAVEELSWYTWQNGGRLVMQLAKQEATLSYIPHEILSQERCTYKPLLWCYIAVLCMQTEYEKHNDSYSGFGLILLFGMLFSLVEPCGAQN